MSVSAGLLVLFLLAGCLPGPNRPQTQLTAIPFVPTATFGLTAPAPAASASSPLPTAFQPAATAPPAPTASPEPPTPAATAEAPLRFAVIGDYGGGGQAEADVAGLVKSWGVEFIITTGDNNYPDGAAETIDANVGQFYHDYLQPYTGSYGPGADRNRFFPTLGNHDWNTAHAQAYLDYFTLPGNERYYDFTWGPVHFFALDADSREPDGVGRSSTQAAWLQAGLAQSTSPWKVVYFHQPPYSSGMHGSVDWMRWPFREWGASVVLSGHDHVYERLLVDGLTYFINGIGGGEIYYFDNILEGSQARYDGDYGALLATASTNELAFQFINRSGELIDAYALTR